MIRVNLLPFRAARTKENVKRQVVVFIALIVLFVVMCLAYTVTLMNDVAELEDKYAQAESDLVRYKKQAAEVDAILAEIAILEKREATIEGLKKQRYEVVKMMDYLTGLVKDTDAASDSMQDQRLWLTKLLIASDKDLGDFGSHDINITGCAFEGTAVSNNDIAAFLDRLENFTEEQVNPMAALKVGGDNGPEGEEPEGPKPYFVDVRLKSIVGIADANTPELLGFKKFVIGCARPSIIPEPEENSKKKAKANKKH